MAETVTKVTRMTTLTHGWIFRHVGLHNPVGFFLGHKMTELDLGRCDVMAHTGLDAATLDAALDPQTEVCVTDTATRAKMIDLLIARKARLPDLRWDSDRLFFGLRAQALHEGVELLAQYARCLRSGATAEAHFDAAARKAGQAVHASAMMIFGEAAWGHLDRECKLMTLHDQLIMRRRFGKLLMRIEAHHHREEALTDEARAFIAASDIWSGINAAADQIETWEVLGRPVRRSEVVRYLEVV